MYLVIECCDREISDVKTARDAAESVRLANGMLEDHLQVIGYGKDEPDGEDLQRCGPGDGESCAWCNLKNMKFDAFRVALGSDGARTALDILLKELCRAEMSAPGSGCGDGSCEDCPITKTLEMLSGAAG